MNRGTCIEALRPWKKNRRPTRFLAGTMKLRRAAFFRQGALGRQNFIAARGTKFPRRRHTALPLMATAGLPGRCCAADCLHGVVTRTRPVGREGLSFGHIAWVTNLRG